MTAAPPIPQPPSASTPIAGNASALLAVAGVLLILAGLGCGGGMIAYAVMMPMLLNSAPPGAEASIESAEAMRPMMLLSAILYGGIAAGIIWLGIGSIRARRWAWKIAVSLGWMWVAAVGLGAISYTVILPKMMKVMTSGSGPASSTPSDPLFSVIMIVGALIGLMFYAAPGVALIVIYGLRNVRLTCEHRDSLPRWTDRVPIPVLAFWLLMVFCLFASIAFAPAHFGILKVPGVSNLVPQPLGLVIWLVAVPLICLACWDLAAMRIRGWWTSVVLCALGTGAAIWIGMNYDYMSVYREMSIPKESLAEMEQMLDGAMFVPTVLTSVAVLAYAIWLKRFFNRPAEA